DVFDGATAERRLSDYFAVATSAAFGTLSRLELNAAAAAVTYVERTQLGKRPPLSPPVREEQGATLSIDQATRANLELTRTLGGERRGSLLAAIDRTVTSANDWTASRCFRPTHWHGRKPGSILAPHRTCRGRSRGWWSGAADRATS